VRIIVRHSDYVDPEQRGARSRKIKSIFVETSEGERIKLPHNNLRYARAMARHVSEGGQLMDDFGQHITRIAEECGKLRPFKNSVRRRTFEDSETQAMVEAAFEYHGLLNNTLKRMSGRKGYARCKESFQANEETLMDDFDVDSMRERFVRKTYNDATDQALPIVQKAYKMKKQNKFAQQFESWATNVAESWEEDDSVIDVDDLADLFADELPIGVDAINAINAVSGIINSDDLENELTQAAQQDPEADARDVIIGWLFDNQPGVYQELMNEIGDADTADEYNEGNTYGASGMDEPNVNEGEYDEDNELPYDFYTEVIDELIQDNRRLMSPSRQPIVIKRVQRIINDTAKEDKVPYHFDQGMFDEAYKEIVQFHKDMYVNETDHGIELEGEYDEDQVESIQSAILRRILGNIGQHSELLKKAGPDGVMNAARDVASFHAPVEELGSSDISIMVREVYNEVGVEYPELNEGRMKEVATDIEELSNKQFYAKYKMSKEDMKANLSEGNLRVARSDQRKNREAKYYDWLAKNADDFEHYADADIEENVGDDHVNKKEKLARAGAHRAPRQPEQSFMDIVKSTVKGAKAWVKGEDDSMYESDDNELNEMLRIAGLK
jgi:hypothetical protein